VASLFARISAGARSRLGRAVLIGAAIVVPTAALGLYIAHTVQSNEATNYGGITQDQYDAVKKGQSESSVLDSLGRPRTQQELEYNAPVPSGDECIYYFDSAGAFQAGNSYRFCFKNGVLDLKDGIGSSFDNSQPDASSSAS
jgi:hypothetical protein